ncbi:uncharacterized protein LOC107620361 [Arachis ipaensis]|uniref:uncharacterized protein LOC107620361 n=1 Tax=Arachis ipaensis TaxID=130454 RepID=UPI0007AFDF4E|nr:uncharacterized protein LOC107620361 [Arachis ipaensis]
MVITNEFGQSPVDKAIAEEAGDVTVDQFLQELVIRLRIASLGRSQEIRHRKSSRLSEESNKLNEELKSKKSVIAELEARLVEKEKELTSVKDKYDKEADMLKKKSAELSSMQEQMIEATMKMKELEKGKQTEILDAFVEGFERAILQVKFLLPGQDLSQMDPRKIVRDGSLVDDEEIVEDGLNHQV